MGRSEDVSFLVYTTVQQRTVRVVLKLFLLRHIYHCAAENRMSGSEAVSF
jgi:hypothetical protein